MSPNGGPNAPLPPWLRNGRPGAARSGGFSPAALRGPALLIAGAVHRLVPARLANAGARAGAAAHGRGGAAVPGAGALPRGGDAVDARARDAPGEKGPHPLALHPLPSERPATEEDRREALRAFAQAKASDLRDCLGDPGRGPLRRVGAALEIDSHGSVAAVQILGGEGSSRELDSCYSARLRSWRFPQALLQGDERLLVNFVL